jgi:beta-lactam-binding protein with PASTA domain
LAAALLDVGTIGTQSSATVPAGFVLAEAPAAGTSLAISSAVNLLVSTGPAPVAVPNVVGDRQSVATLAITSAKLAVGTIASTSSATVPAGEIISQSPAAGTTLKVGGSVNLSVSSGAALVPVPSVIGLTQAAAGADLSKAGLSMGTVTSQASATVAAGKILGQSPAAGAKVAKASKVNLAISTGPVLVVTPKVVGLTEAKAKAVLQNAGETLGAVTTAANPLPAGEVISQSPLANAKAARGSAVRVVISTGK